MMHTTPPAPPPASLKILTFFSGGSRFPIAADMGCWDGQVLKRIAGNIGGITTLHQCDSSQAMLDLCREGNVGGVAASRLLVDDETEFPFERESLDLVISNLSLHWINDIPGAMVRAREALRPDGLFLASMFGGNTLNELRCAMAVAELERDGGISSHVSPMAGISDAGSLLGRAGFTIPAVDSDTIVVQFPSAMDVMHTLQAMGENNAGVTRRPFVSKDTMLAAAAVYEAMYGGDEGVPATFQVMYLSGWAPHATQQQPKTRGTAKFSLAEIGDVNILDDQPPAGSGSPIVAPWAQAAKSPLDTSREK